MWQITFEIKKVDLFFYIKLIAFPSTSRLSTCCNKCWLWTLKSAFRLKRRYCTITLSLTRCPRRFPRWSKSTLSAGSGSLSLSSNSKKLKKNNHAKTILYFAFILIIVSKINLIKNTISRNRAWCNKAPSLNCLCRNLAKIFMQMPLVSLK